MSSDLVPDDISKKYEVFESRHALAILHSAFPEHWSDIINVLRNFELRTSDIAIGGGGRSLVSEKLDDGFEENGWGKRGFNTKIVVDDVATDTPTHEVDCFKDPIALEVEWNNKTEFYDRDLNNFRLLFDLRAISVGVIITRDESLIPLFQELDIFTKFGQSTTWMSKLVRRLQGGSGGGCPVAVFGIKDGAYVADLNRGGIEELNKRMKVERENARREKRKQDPRGVIKSVTDDAAYKP